MAFVAIVNGERLGNRWQKKLRKKGEKYTFPIKNLLAISDPV